MPIGVEQLDATLVSLSDWIRGCYGYHCLATTVECEKTVVMGVLTNRSFISDRWRRRPLQ